MRGNRLRTTAQSRRRCGWRIFAACAAMLAVTLVNHNRLPYMEPASTAMAKESLSGIRQIVKEHGEENPFVILDIVPGKADCMGYDFSLGTIGYLVDGQAPVQQDLRRIFAGEDSTAFYSYTERTALAEAVIGNLTGSFPEISYQEAYAGTGESLDAADGWVKIFDSVLPEGGDLPADCPDGRLYAEVERISAADGEEQEGYDYQLVGGSFDASAAETPGAGEIYLADPAGNYHVIFGSPAENTSGYRVSTADADWRNYADPTAVYCRDGDGFRYAGTVKGLREASGEYEDSAKSASDSASLSEGWYCCVESGGDGAVSGDSAEFAGERSVSDNTVGQHGGEQQPEEDDGQSPAEWPAAEESSYYILTFSYVENLDTAELLYQVESEEWIQVQEGEARPFDSYSLSVLERDDTRPARDEEELPAAEEDKVPEGSFVYVGAGRGTYKLTGVRSAEKTDDGGSGGIALPSGAHYIEVRNAPVFMRCRGGNDWLKRDVFSCLQRQDDEPGGFAIEVRTSAAGEVTSEMVQDADLIYLEDGAGIYLSEGASKQYIGAGGAVADLSGGAAARILYQAVEKLTPVIVDYGILTNEQDYSGSNYQKLAGIFLKKDLAAFYEDMGCSDDLAGSFLANGDKAFSDYPDKTDNNYHYVNRNVYVVNGSPLVGEDFLEEFDENSAKAGFGEVLAAIRAENAALADDARISEKVSKAMAVQYIVNFSAGLSGDYRDLSILELQPTANEVSDLRCSVDSGLGGTVLCWQREDQDRAGQQILRSLEEIDVDITVESVAAFNGEYQDINNRYDMIFIGLDGQRFYRERGAEGGLEAVYNDSSLNGKVYHGGDQVSGGDVRYDASDITEQKKEALLDYMRAGYPIIVESDCFKGKSARKAKERDINTDYIGSDTVMYRFLKEAVAEHEDYIYTIEDVHGSALFQAQLNAVRPKIARREESASGQIETSRTETGDYRGTIAYRLSGDGPGDDENYPGELTKHLYLDWNYDGVFAPAEEIYEYTDTPLEGGGEVCVDFREVCFGIVPWKLEVSDAGNRYRRDAIEGYFTIQGEGRTTVRVLQVSDNPERRAANLQRLCEEPENSLLAYYLSGAETLLNMEFEIETVTPAALAERLGRNGQYLSGWDVLVLGFGDSGHPGDVVASAVNEYLAAGGSAVISSAGSREDSGRFGIQTDYLGQTEGRSYGALGAGSGEKYRYRGLQSGMFDAAPSLCAEKINAGSIAEWPYPVGGTVTLGGSTKVQPPAYLLDIDAPSHGAQAYTTVWYTLNQAGSEANVYNVSPRDAANNYYLYSKGGVVYVGQSEYPYRYDRTGGEAPETLEGAGESMLFVNALMAAYSSGVHPAELSIVAGFSASAAEIESIVVPFDQELGSAGDADSGILDETVDVYFRFADNNLAQEKTGTVKFYYGGEDVEPSALSRAAQFESPIWTVENNRLVEVSPDMLRPGQIYRIKAPLAALEQDGGAGNTRIYVAVQVAFGRSGEPHSAAGADSVSLNRAQLFRLE